MFQVSGLFHLNRFQQLVANIKRLREIEVLPSPSCSKRLVSNKPVYNHSIIIMYIYAMQALGNDAK